MKLYPSNLHVALVDANKLAEKIESLLVETGGEVTPELEDLLAFKDMSEKDLKCAIDYHLIAMDRMEKSLEFYQDQIDALKKLQESISKAQDRMRANLASHMDSLNLSRIEGQYYKVSFRQSPPAVQILDEEAVSPEFKQMKITETVKKKEIAEFLKKGGALDWARLIQNRTLKIDRAQLTQGDKDDE
jgi:hypothetical protein